MIIRQIFNNNVIRAENQVGHEFVVIGNGLGFKKKNGQRVDEEKIEKTFVLKSDKIPQKLIDLIGETSVEYLKVADEIVGSAKKEMGNIFSDNIYISLIDHIQFAISRYRKSVGLKNSLLWQIKKFYKKEFMIGMNALDIIHAQFGIQMDEHEASFIAMHFVNARQDGQGMKQTVEITEVIDDIFNIVTDYYQITLDETSFNYSRFITHLQYFAQRLLSNEQEQLASGDNFLYDQVKEKYERAFQCTQLINQYLELKHESAMSIDEKVYLTIHIQRVTSRNDLADA
ncbi:MULTISPECIES: BglG family transcription antiterminator LicT [Paenibacillus]|jgi:beta-glucoside operon transcriptional antiterminator|uniref:BglG family transcription antiterminator LicT n=1 Tax=Paenibacillus TaxID=44249 RepID=UPI000D30A1E5|nr:MULTISPECIES: PRD domain-containing protein [Paenibacillus]MDP9676686.1 beta-glucoside operon transcriptional antiterminator [Paenibacillus jamilae]KAF6619111.1 PRD domain-containing protein [Paenibacillus sp. EKM101P]KAF6624202.1 PRD domain-containing protein [Paenibacillus sp. EKM102P]KAF6636023.1 PRD domain-containing protein [Paenibacillus sp. EKM10P]KAF6648273.1 PRD domain-containing protein [Paenibacillus sp. EKM11P]